MTLAAPNRTRPPSRRAVAWTAALAAVFLLAVLLVVWGVAMRRDINHDEHQFVASAALIARDGLLPYRDFPYFHVPTLSFVYALLYRAADSLLLTARAVSVACSWVMLALLLGVALVWPRNLALTARLGLGIAVVLLLVATPSFLHASGRAWNHDAPVLLTLSAACLQGAWLQRNGRQPLWLLASGLAVGLAAGIRSSYALLAVPFALSIFFVLPWRIRQAWLALACLALGGLVGLVPTLYAFSQSPDRFIFGNLTYAQLNTAWYRQFGANPAALSLWGKLWQTATDVLILPGNLLLLILAAFAVWRARKALRTRAAAWLWFLLALLPFLLVGAYLPTPLQAQYLYPLYPLLALIVIVAFRDDPAPRLPLLVTAGAAAIALAFSAVRLYEGAEIALNRNEWYPAKVHTRGELMAHLAGGERTLTLAPIWPLEGGAPIYPEFVTGPFALRVASLLSPQDRQRFGMVDLSALEQDLAAQPPRAILTGVHTEPGGDAADPEGPFEDYARAHGYAPIPLPEEGTLWASQLAAWADTVRLAAVDLPDHPVAPGSKQVLTFYLQAIQTPARNYNVLVRLVAPDGKTDLVRSEGWPQGKPTGKWPPGEVWADGHALTIPADAKPGPYRVEISFYDPATLDLLGDGPVTAGYVLVEDKQAKRTAAPLADFGGCFQLLDAAVPQAGWSAGADQTVRLTWQRTTKSTAPQSADKHCGGYTVFVHLAGPNGLIAQRDQVPLQGFYPTDAWLVGAPVTDEYALTLPATVPAGEYQLVAGLYDPANGQRLPLLRDGKPAGDAYMLGTVNVK